MAESVAASVIFNLLQKAPEGFPADQPPVPSPAASIERVQQLVGVICASPNAARAEMVVRTCQLSSDCEQWSSHIRGTQINILP
eukprot:SAG31_NODE_972_length_10644_cov_3.435372_2_plen_84_part_00